MAPPVQSCQIRHLSDETVRPDFKNCFNYSVTRRLRSMRNIENIVDLSFAIILIFFFFFLSIFLEGESIVLHISHNTISKKFWPVLLDPGCDSVNSCSIYNILVCYIQCEFNLKLLDIKLTSFENENSQNIQKPFGSTKMKSKMIPKTILDYNFILVLFYF